MRGKGKRLVATSILAAVMFSSSANAGPICDLVGKGLDKLGKQIYKCCQKVDQFKAQGKLLKKVKGAYKGKCGRSQCGSSQCGCR